MERTEPTRPAVGAWLEMTALRPEQCPLLRPHNDPSFSHSFTSQARRRRPTLANIDRVARGSLLLLFRHRQRKHTLVKLRESVLRIGVFRHRDRAREAPICPLKPIAAVLLAVHILLFLTAHYQRPIIDADVQILPLHAWQLDSHAQYLPFVDHADARPRTR